MLPGFWLGQQYVRAPDELRWTDGRIASGANRNGTINPAIAVVRNAEDTGANFGRQTKMDRLRAVR